MLFIRCPHCDHQIPDDPALAEQPNSCPACDRRLSRPISTPKQQVAAWKQRGEVTAQKSFAVWAGLRKGSRLINRALRAVAGEGNDVLYRFFQFLTVALLAAFLAIIPCTIFSSPEPNASRKPSGPVDPATAATPSQERAMPTRRSFRTSEPSAGLTKFEAFTEDFVANRRVLWTKNGQDVPIAVSQKAHDGFWTAFDYDFTGDDDEDGKAMLTIALAISTDLILWTPSETSCQVLDAGSTSSKVLLLSGPNSGRAVFVKPEFIRER